MFYFLQVTNITQVHNTKAHIYMYHVPIIFQQLFQKCELRLTMMLNQTVIFLLLWVIIALVVGITLAGKIKLSDLHEQKIEQRLKQLNKPAVKSIHVFTTTFNYLLFAFFFLVNYLWFAIPNIFLAKWFYVLL